MLFIMVAGVCNLATVTLSWHLLLVFSTDQQALILSLVLGLGELRWHNFEHNSSVEA